MNRRTLLLLPWVTVWGTAAAAELTIPFVDTAPVLAEFVIQESTTGARASMTVVTDFTQRVPTDGAAATQRTDVYLGYDARNLYAVFMAFDSEPQNVRANLASRENIDNDDRVGILVDTFNDQRAAYGFRSSPLGVQWDGRWSEASRGASYDTAYEAVWYTDAQRTDFGYVVLMTIPFRTMRFPESGEQQWRIQFERLIPRLSEESYWPAYSQSVDGRLNQAATLTGVRDVSPGRNIQLIPFAFVRSYDVLDPDLAGGPGFSEDTEDDLGLDAKFVLRDSLVLDLTYNPDFSQVESDQPQVTVNERYEVQFPEKRPFFLENADYFTTETPLVFTRRIVDPEMGLKFTGRQGPWGIGTMLINDEAQGAELPEADPLHGEIAEIGIVRMFRDVGEQSRVGMLYTEREFGDEYNRVAAADTRVRLSDNWSTELLFVNTDTRLPGGEVVAGRQTNWRFDRNGRHALAHIHWTQQSDEFRAQLGILGRNYQPDTRGPHGNVQYKFWPTDAAIDSWGPRVGFTYQEDQTGLRTYANLQPRMELTWAGDSWLEVGFNKTRERLRPKDFAVLTSNRDYGQRGWSTAMGTYVFTKFGFNFQLTDGTTINFVPPVGEEPELEDSFGAQVNFLWRPTGRLRVDTNYLLTEVDDRGGAGRIFDNQIVRTRWNYQFTKEWSLRFIAQHERTRASPLTSLVDDENLNFDVLGRYVINPWSALYIGYNTNSSNFQLVDSGQGTEVVATDDLARDGSSSS